MIDEINEARFLSNIEVCRHGLECNECCWEWLGTTYGRGDKDYGRAVIDKKAMLAHRFSYMLFKGPIPNGLLVCHSCDNPPCVNPHHLWAGTCMDNKRDSIRKGRHSKGISNSLSQIGKIRSSNSSGHVGVCYRKLRNKYTASIQINKISKYLGAFSTAEEAVVAYNKALEDILNVFK